MGLIEDNIGTARRIARQMLRRMPASLELADVEQTALEALVRCCRAYDPARGPVDAYVRRAVSNALYRLAGAEVSLRRQPLSAYHDPRVVVDDGEWDLSDLGDQAEGIERGTLSAHLRRAIDALPDTERELVLAMYGIEREPVPHDRVIEATRQAAEQRRDKALLRMRRQLEPAIPRRRVGGEQYVPPRRVTVRLDRAQWEEAQMPRVSGPGWGKP